MKHTKQRAFVKLEGIRGTSQIAGHAGEIEINKGVFAYNEKGPFGPVLEFKFIKKIDSTSPRLQLMIQAGEKIKKATLTIEKTEDGKTIRTDRVEMVDVQLDSLLITTLDLHTGGAGEDVPDEPAEVDRITVDQVTLGIGKLVYPNVMALLTENILSNVGLHVG